MTLLKVSYCSAISALRKTKHCEHKYTHTQIVTFQSRQFILEHEGEWLIENNNSKMVVPLKYFCLKYLLVHGKGGSGFMMILPELVPGSVLSAKQTKSKVSTISSTLFCNRAHLLWVRYQPLCSQALHVLSF